MSSCVDQSNCVLLIHKSSKCSKLFCNSNKWIYMYIRMGRIKAHMFSSEANGGSKQIADNESLPSDHELYLPIIFDHKKLNPLHCL